MVNTAIILAGGVGSRMDSAAVPKQYLMMQDRPIIDYCLREFQRHELIDNIIIVADPRWYDFIEKWLQISCITKFAGFALPGETRQYSILNGLEFIKTNYPKTTNVIIHDAARPLVSEEIITACLSGLDHADGVMPVLPIKDTCYQSIDGKTICGFLPRMQIFAGQAPEAFRFPQYLELHYSMEKGELLQISGSSELAYKCGMKVQMVPGTERNFKITTKDDLMHFAQHLESEGDQ